MTPPRSLVTRPSRSARRWLGSALVVALLFMQFAVAAYVCSGLRAGHAEMDMSAMADMTDCAGMSAQQMDPAQPQLCKAHCSHDDQSVQSGLGQLAPDLAAALFVAIVDWRPQAMSARAGAMSMRTVRAPTGPPRGWPPLYLALHILRN